MSSNSAGGTESQSKEVSPLQRFSKDSTARTGSEDYCLTKDGLLGRMDTVVEDGEQLHMSNRGELHDIPDEPDGKSLHWPTLMAYVGPGFLVCIAYLDPGNLEADLQAGAYTGYQLLWVLLMAHVMGLVLQSLAARLGVVTGTHLADVCRMFYPRPVALMLWLMTESAIVGSDIQEVVGSAIGLQILFGIPLWAGCLLTALDTFTFLFIHVFGVRKLEGLFLFLVSVMTVAFFVDFGISPPNAVEVAEGFSFTIQSYALVTALGLIGAVIMPHNIYLHSALVLSRSVDRSNPRKLWEAIKYYTIDCGAALAVAFLINLAVVCTFAKQFYGAACTTTSTLSACFVGATIDASQPSYGICHAGEGLCQEIGLSAAADALKGTLGSAAKYVWAVGLLAAGQSSTMTGTYAGQFVMEGFLQLKIPKWQRVLITRVIALGPALAVTLYMGDNTRATDRLSAWLNVLQSLQLPFAVIPLLTFCNSRRIMGEFAIKPAMTTFVWILSLAIIAINLYIVGGFVVEQASSSEDGATRLYTASGIIAGLYLALIAAVVSQDLPWYHQQAGDRYTKLGGRIASGSGSYGSSSEGYGRSGDYLPPAEISPEISSGITSGGDAHNWGSKRPLVPAGLGDGFSARVAGYSPPAGQVNEEQKSAEGGEGREAGKRGRDEMRGKRASVSFAP